MLLAVAVIFCLGLAIGSFLNVVIYRSVHHDSPLRGRSYCDSCKKPIAWYDNIPLISFIVLRRKCRHCHAIIPWEYPTVELLTGLLFVWWYVVGFTFFKLTELPFGFLQPLFWLTVGILFVVIVFADLSYMIIPDSAVLLLSIAALSYRGMLVAQGIMSGDDFWKSIASAVGAVAFFLFLTVVTKGKGMGMGDVKLAFPLGLILGFPLTIVAIFLSFILGSVVAIPMLVLRQKKLKSVIPFGPFLILGSVIALVWGEPLLAWYVQFL